MTRQPSRRVVARVGACVLAAACLAGCGSAATPPLSKAAYDKQMVAIGKSFGADFDPLSAANTAHKAQLSLTKIQGELAATEEKLASITPPAPVKAEHARLVAAVGEFESELGPVIAKLKTGDLNALGSVTSLKGFKDIDKALQAIVNAGYDIS